MGQIRDKMEADLRLCGYQLTTQREYLLRARHFAAHFRRSPADMGEIEVREYLLYLVNVKKVRPATHHMYVAALKFLYATTLGRPQEVAQIPWPKVPKTLPTILSGEEVLRLFNAIRSLKHRALIMTAYGAGLRIAETCSLQIGDIDSNRMLIHVHQGKGSKDRYVMLSERLLGVLRQYFKHARPVRPWLFPGGQPGCCITPCGMRWGLKRAVKSCGLTKRVTPHTLRHSFATHMLELGNDVRLIQMLLGHSSIRTTARYTFVSPDHIGRTKSPLDLLGRKEGEVLG